MTRNVKPKPFNPDYVVPPGATLHELMSEGRMTKEELAAQSGLDIGTINHILGGSPRVITEAVANGLALAFKLPATFWLRREEAYVNGLAVGKAVASEYVGFL